MLADLVPKLDILPPVVKDAYENDEFEWDKEPGKKPSVNFLSLHQEATFTLKNRSIQFCELLTRVIF